VEEEDILQETAGTKIEISKIHIPDLGVDPIGEDTIDITDKISIQGVKDLTMTGSSFLTKTNLCIRSRR
jgi:hypothetical protein